MAAASQHPPRTTQRRRQRLQQPALFFRQDPPLLLPPLLLLQQHMPEERASRLTRDATPNSLRDANIAAAVSFCVALAHFTVASGSPDAAPGKNGAQIAPKVGKSEAYRLLRRSVARRKAKRLAMAKTALAYCAVHA